MFVRAFFIARIHIIIFVESFECCVHSKYTNDIISLANVLVELSRSLLSVALVASVSAACEVKENKRHSNWHKKEEK